MFIGLQICIIEFKINLNGSVSVEGSYGSDGQINTAPSLTCISNHSGSCTTVLSKVT